MKAKLSFALAVLAFSVALQPVPTPDQPIGTVKDCAAICARTLCVPNQTCGLYTNGSGQTVCGCHDSSGV
jgi:hypothetical protein